MCGLEMYKRRKETVERSFANAKQLHGYRYARYRGLERMKEQAYMTAIVQNIKKMASIFWKRKYPIPRPITIFVLDFIYIHYLCIKALKYHQKINMLKFN